MPTRLGLRDKHIHQQVFLEDSVHRKIEGSDGKNNRLQRREAEGDGRVEEKVVVVGSVFKWHWLCPFNILPRCGSHEGPFKPDDRHGPELSNVDGSTKGTLQHVRDPEG